MQIVPLCRNCNPRDQNIFISRVGDNNTLVECTGQHIFRSYPVLRAPINDLSYLCLLENLQQQRNNGASITPLAASSTEHKFISHYFNSTKGNGQQNVIQVSKIKNTPLQRQFNSELQNNAEKNRARNLNPNSMMRLLWFGTNTKDPAIIAQSENGIDLAQSVHGLGIYFQNTAGFYIANNTSF